MNIKKTKAKYLALHNALGSRKDADDKELFDQQHGKVWHDYDIEFQERKAKLLTKPNPTANELVELAKLESMYPTPSPEPTRDLAAEIDKIKAKVGALEQQKE